MHACIHARVCTAHTYAHEHTESNVNYILAHTYTHTLVCMQIIHKQIHGLS